MRRPYNEYLDVRYNVVLFCDNDYYSDQLSGYMASSNLRVVQCDLKTIGGAIKTYGAHVYILDLFTGEHARADMQGLDLIVACRDLHESSGIMLLSGDTALDDPNLRIGAYRAGADAIVQAPVNLNELVYQVRALALRTGICAMPDRDKYELGRFTFYPRENLLDDGYERIDLDNSASKALELLLYYEGQLVSYRDLMLWTRGYEAEGSLNALKVNVAGLRRLLEGEGIKIVNTELAGYTLSGS